MQVMRVHSLSNSFTVQLYIGGRQCEVEELSTSLQIILSRCGTDTVVPDSLTWGAWVL